MPKVENMPGFSCTHCDWSSVLACDTCPKCRSQVKEVSFSGQGKIDTFTVIRYPPEGFEKESPYVVALIDLLQGPRVIARIVDASEDLLIGQNVFFFKISNGRLEFKVKR